MSSPGRFPLGLQRRIGHRRLRRIVLGAIPFVALATLWQMNALYGWLAPIHVPPPAAVWNVIFALQEGCPGVIDALRQSPSCLFTNHVLSSMGRVISVDYEPLPALVDVDAALAPGAAVRHAEIGSNVVAEWRQRVGDLDAACRSADIVVVRRRIRLARGGAHPLEPRARRSLGRRPAHRVRGVIAQRGLGYHVDALRRSRHRGLTS